MLLTKGECILGVFWRRSTHHDYLLPCLRLINSPAVAVAAEQVVVVENLCF